MDKKEYKEAIELLKKCDREYISLEEWLEIDWSMIGVDLIHFIKKLVGKYEKTQRYRTIMKGIRRKK